MMLLNIDDCQESSKHPIIVARQKGESTEFQLNNPNRRLILKINVDECPIMQDSNDIRPKCCDYVFEIDTPMIKAVYVELKGGHISDGLKQINSKLDLFKTRHHKIDKECHIVATRVAQPKTDSSRQIQEARLRKIYNLTAKISTQKHTIQI